MDKSLNTAGYDLYEITENEWIIHVRGGVLFAGTFKNVITHAASKMGFDLEEMEFAVQEMVKHGHNAAHFGMYRGFIFTYQKDFKSLKHAS